jgi:hypothetical protein
VTNPNYQKANTSMKTIGVIKFVQIQQASLKAHHADGTRYYNPTPLLHLKRIQLTADGVIGLTESNDAIIDVHHIKHPQSRHRGDNPISIGFTSHYAHMRATYGDHLTDGIAGESIIVETSTHYTPESLGDHLAIYQHATNTYIDLNDIIPIPPCEPFSRFAQNRDLTPPETKATLQFLSNGTRGFYGKLSNINITPIIQAGDTLVQID